MPERCTTGARRRRLSNCLPATCACTPTVVALHDHHVRRRQHRQQAFAVRAAPVDARVLRRRCEAVPLVQVVADREGRGRVLREHPLDQHLLRRRRPRRRTGPTGSPRPPAPGSRPTGRPGRSPHPRCARKAAAAARASSPVTPSKAGLPVTAIRAAATPTGVDQVAPHPLGQHRDAVRTCTARSRNGSPVQGEQVHHRETEECPAHGPRLDRRLLAARRLVANHHVGTELLQDAPEQLRRPEPVAPPITPESAGGGFAQGIDPLQEIEAEIGERFLARDPGMRRAVEQLLAADSAACLPARFAAAEIAQPQRLLARRAGRRRRPW